MHQSYAWWYSYFFTVCSFERSKYTIGQSWVEVEEGITTKLFRYIYSHKIFIGLIFSCCGDALLNLNLFAFGMIMFGVAQVFYISAFGFKPLKLWIGLVLYIFGAVGKFHSRITHTSALIKSFIIKSYVFSHFIFV